MCVRLSFWPLAMSSQAPEPAVFHEDASATSVVSGDSQEGEGEVYIYVCMLVCECVGTSQEVALQTFFCGWFCDQSPLPYPSLGIPSRLPPRLPPASLVPAPSQNLCLWMP